MTLQFSKINIKCDTCGVSDDYGHTFLISSSLKLLWRDVVEITDKETGQQLFEESKHQLTFFYKGTCAKCHKKIYE